MLFTSTNHRSFVATSANVTFVALRSADARSSLHHHHYHTLSLYHHQQQQQHQSINTDISSIIVTYAGWTVKGRKFSYNTGLRTLIHKQTTSNRHIQNYIKWPVARVHNYCVQQNRTLYRVPQSKIITREISDVL